MDILDKDKHLIVARKSGFDGQDKIDDIHGA